jgi:hypothetical protein
MRPRRSTPEKPPTKRISSEAGKGLATGKLSKPKPGPSRVAFSQSGHQQRKSDESFFIGDDFSGELALVESVAAAVPILRSIITVLPRRRARLAFVGHSPDGILANLRKINSQPTQRTCGNKSQ